MVKEGGRKKGGTGRVCWRELQGDSAVAAPGAMPEDGRGSVQGLQLSHLLSSVAPEFVKIWLRYFVCQYTTTHILAIYGFGKCSAVPASERHNSPGKPAAP